MKIGDMVEIKNKSHQCLGKIVGFGHSCIYCDYQLSTDESGLVVRNKTFFFQDYDSFIVTDKQFSKPRVKFDSLKPGDEFKIPGDKNVYIKLKSLGHTKPWFNKVNYTYDSYHSDFMVELP